jgi:peroxiredoxin Q/BCP
MLKRIISILSLIICQAVYAMPQIGEFAPDFTADNFSLSSAKGKILVLYFYPKDNTSNCTVEAVQFAANASEFQALGAEIVGASMDSQNSHEKFKQENNLPFTLISADKNLVNQYGVSGLFWTKRTTFLIDKKGKIAYIWTNVSVAKHAEEVLQKIKELGL